VEAVPEWMGTKGIASYCDDLRRTTRLIVHTRDVFGIDCTSRTWTGFPLLRTAYCYCWFMV